MNIVNLYTAYRSNKGLRFANRMLADINQHTQWAQQLSDEALSQAFQSLFHESLASRTAKGFALVREAAGRVSGMRHFDVQLIGGVVLLEGKLAEMRTGEGKTLTVTLPAAVLALERRGVHVVTSNAYLARRDAELMRPVYEALGLSVAAVYSEQSVAEKQAAYACDVTYGVGSEFGFDYLKDHLVRDADQQVQRGLYAAVVDEIDSVLIDEARVPLIIADKAADESELVRVLDTVMRGLQPDLHFKINAKERSAELNEAGYAAVEAALVASGHLDSAQQLYDGKHLHWVRRLHSAVRAYSLYRKDRDYVVHHGELVLVDTGTGRKMEGRRFEDGLHEALEAREQLRVRSGTVTKASITYQSFFALYEKLSGLTGTAATDAEEFTDIYRLETVLVPTNMPMIRQQREDMVFLNKSDKFAAAVTEVALRHDKGQPVLVGCSTIRDAEVLSRLLSAAGVPHNTLTARQVEKEAHIIAQAGRAGAVTVATNMAGRGTDILLGGEKPVLLPGQGPASFEASQAAWKEEQARVISLGGLFVLGTERNGLRRVDNQLAGRSGRQGNPGEVQYMLSLEDELLRVFGQSKQFSVVRRLVQASGSALGGQVVGRFVESAQKNVEGQGFGARKSLMQFDSVLSDQRKAVFSLRASLLKGECKAYVEGSALLAVRQWVTQNMPESSMPETWAVGSMKKELLELFGLDVPLVGWVNRDELSAEEVADKVTDAAKSLLAGAGLEEADCRALAFDALDASWTEHLLQLSELRENVSLKGNTGFNSVYQFHKDAFELFQGFESQLNLTLADLTLKPQQRAARQGLAQVQSEAATAASRVAVALERRWVTRNELCPCGSGKRFKLCHGAFAPEL